MSLSKPVVDGVPKPSQPHRRSMSKRSLKEDKCVRTLQALIGYHMAALKGTRELHSYSRASAVPEEMTPLYQPRLPAVHVGHLRSKACRTYRMFANCILPFQPCISASEQPSLVQGITVPEGLTRTFAYNKQCILYSGHSVTDICGGRGSAARYIFSSD